MAIDRLQTLIEQYASALQDYCLHSDRNDSIASDLGKQAVEAGFTLTDLIHCYQQALDALLQMIPAIREGVALAKLASDFFAQSLLSFERSRQQAEDTLRRSEEQFRAIFEHAEIGIVVTDSEHRIAHANSFFQNTLQYSATELAAFGFIHVTHPDDLALEQPLINECLAGTRDTYRLEKRYIRKDGETVWSEMTGVVVRDAIGQVQYSIVTMTDTTAQQQARQKRQQAEAALQQLNAELESRVQARTAELAQTNAELEALFRILPDSFFRVAADGTYLECRGQSSQDFYLPPDELVGRKVQDVLPSPIGQAFHATYQAVLQRNELVSMDYALTIGGVEKHYEARFVPIQPDQVMAIVRNISDRKRAETALRLHEAEICRSRDLFAGIFEASADALFLVNPVTNGIINCNQRAVELFEVGDSTTLLGRVGSTFHKEPFSPEDIANAFVQLETVGGWSQEIEYITQKGNTFWGYCTAKRIQVNNEPLHLLRVTDITDRKRMEAGRQLAEIALRKSEDRFRRIVANIPGMVYQYVTRSDGSAAYTYVSPGCQQVCELEPAAVLADPAMLWSMTHPDDVPSLQQAVAVSMTTMQPLHHEHRFITPTGQIKWVQLNSHRERLANGDVVAEGVVIDITSRKRAEAALHQSEARFQHLAANLPGVFYQSVMHPDGRNQVLYFSSGYQTLFEADPALVLADFEAFWQMVHPDDIALLQEASRRSVESLQTLQYEYRIMTPSGRIKWVYTASSRQRLPNGAIMSDGVVLDITDRKEAERRLQQQAQAAQLMATIAQAMSQSIALPVVLEACLEQTRQFLQCDRVLICRFDGSSTMFIEREAVSHPMFSLLEQTLFDACFGEEWAERYRQGHIAVHHDIQNERQTGAIAPCYADFLAQMQVQASLTVNILQANQLWGLLIVHHCHAPHQWQPPEIDLLKQLGLQIGIASQKASLYAQLETELAERRRAEQIIAQQVERERLLRTLSQQIRQSLRLDQILATTVTEIQRLLAADRAIIFRLNRDRSGVVIQEAHLGRYPISVEMYLTDQHFPQASYDFYLTGQARAVNRVSEDAHAACLLEFMDQIGVKSKLVAPILQTLEDDTPIVWGLLIIHACAIDRQWQPAEVALLQQLATQVGIAIQQANLYTQIKTELAQKEVLLKEIHHRVKNNLQVVSALLTLQADAIQDATALAVLQDSDNRLQAMALIHETLYQSDNLGLLNFSHYIHRLGDSILLANSRYINAINLTYQLETVFLNLDTAIPCGLLLNELVTNAIKHAFPNGQQGVICLSLKRVPNRSMAASDPSIATAASATITGEMLSQEQAPRYILSVSDNGIGMSSDLNLETTKSLGLRIASDLTQQLRGTLVLERNQGTQFHLTFADLSYRKRF